MTRLVIERIEDGLVLKSEQIRTMREVCGNLRSPPAQGFPEALLNLGHALDALGNKDEACACWISALETKPELARGYFHRNSQ